MRYLRFFRFHLTVLLFDLLMLAKDIWQVRIRKLHRVIERTSEGTLAVKERPARLAIVAIYPSDSSLPFTCNLLRALAGLDEHILVLSTRTLTEPQRALLLPLCHRLIERKPVGRDFGSYKLGLELLARDGLLATAESLILANDSMFYPRAFGDEIARMLSSPEPWQCLFENYSGRHHAQSFFLLFGREVFSSRAFISFWRRYRPFSSRQHSILQGEMAFSAALRKARFVVQPAYPSEKVMTVLARSGWSLLDLARRSLASQSWQISGGAILADAAEHQTFRSATVLAAALSERKAGAPLPRAPVAANRTAPTEPRSTPSLSRHDDATSTNDSPFLFEKWLSRIGHTCEQANPTHAVALICNALFSAPIKRDVCYRGSYDAHQIVRLGVGFTTEELAAMARDLRSRGLPSSLRGTTRLLWEAGRI